ncbi:hypothetical protein HYT17_02020 [Candidatus Microgenomates bacterium]|nr:hypothetical protein [Candidatus Microgenomates bacterium]
MKLAFPFQYITTNRFGKVFRPYAKIQVFKKDLGVFVERVLIVDTGADFTIFPRKDAFLFGINLDKETIKEETFGVGGREKIFLYKNLKIKLGVVELLIPAGFLDRNDIPALLGRQQFLELFKVSLANYKTTFEK